MSALRTLKKFLEENKNVYNHPHSGAVLEWFLEKYWGKKEVKIKLNKVYNIMISTKCVEYIGGRYIWGICRKVRYRERSRITDRLMLYSANYCEYCRDKRRRFWEEHQEIIERLPRDAGKFVMNLPMVESPYEYSIMLSDTKLIWKKSWGDWYINHEPVDVDELLREFRKEYNAAKRLKFSEECREFADVSVLCRA